MTDPNAAHSHEAAQAAEAIASDGRDVRQRVRDLVTQLVRERNLSVRDLRDLAKHVVRGAGQGMKDAMPAERDAVLRRVVDGLADGFAVAANATRLAFVEARSRGEAFAEQDVKQTVDDLRTLEESFVESVTNAAGKAGAGMKEQFSELSSHAKRAFTAARPAVQDALRAAAGDPVNLAGQAGKAGAKVTRKAAGALLAAMGGLIDAASEIVEPKD